MAYLVTAACVIAKDQDGKLHHRYEGDVISWLSDEQAEHFLSSGLVEKTDKGVGGSEPVDESDGDGKPASYATKAVLIDWLVENAVDEDGSDYTESKLQPLNKGQLWELINAVED